MDTLAKKRSSSPKRKAPTSRAADEVLLCSRRRCALCYGLHGDLELKSKGQLAHVNRDPSKSEAKDLAWLCLDHHADYDAKRLQSKGFQPGELREYRDELYKKVKALPEEALSGVSLPGNGNDSSASLGNVKVYDRRMTAYRSAAQFIGEITRNATVDLKRCLEFAGESDEVLFLFGPEIAAYYETLFQRGLRIRTLEDLAQSETGEARKKLFEQRYDQLIWFSEQYGDLRGKLYPFLRLH